MSVCLSVCPLHNSETNDLKVFKLGVGNDFRCPRCDIVWGLKGQGHRVNKSIFSH